MNINVTGASAALLIVGMLCVLVPFPGPWLMPFLVVGSWLLIVLWGRNKTPLPVEVEEFESEPVAKIIEKVPEIREVVPDMLGEDILRHLATQDVAKGLKTLVVSDTEAAVLRLTQALFTLVENSKNVSSQIEKSLGFLSNGDSGLGKTVSNLEEQVRVFETLGTHFAQLKEGLSSDISALSQAVGSINQFSDTLSDLADQTNVLAINASIEAARVGIHGRGFAVIATHVQLLSKNSKEISDKMARTVRDVVASVETSFGRQTQRIQNSESLIFHSEKELRRWADNVAPQLSEVETMMNESRHLAGVVTEELGEVTVSLQFQDRTRQVLDHLIEIMEESSHRVVGSASLNERTVPKNLRDEAFQVASRHFTVQEEWDLGTQKRQSVSQTAKAVELF